MELGKEFDELQKLFAQKDLLTEPRTNSGSGFIELQLAKRKNIKVKIYQEIGHRMPRIHIDYGRMHHVASYTINSGERIKGSLPKKYDSDVYNWVARNKDKIIGVWEALQDGNDPKSLVAELPGDV